MQREHKMFLLSLLPTLLVMSRILIELLIEYFRVEPSMECSPAMKTYYSPGCPQCSAVICGTPCRAVLIVCGTARTPRLVMKSLLALRCK